MTDACVARDGQLVSLFKHLKHPVLPIEVCIVQPSWERNAHQLFRGGS